MKSIKNNITTIALSSVALLLLASCAEMPTETHKQASNDVAAATVDADVATTGVRNIPGHTGPANIRVRNSIWLGDQGVRTEHGQPLPAEFQTAEGIVLNSSVPMSIADIANRISEVTGIPVTGATALIDSVPGDAKGKDVLTSVKIPVDYSGPLSTLLNSLASRYNISWQYRNGAIKLYAVETRTFTVLIPSTDTDIRTQITSSILGNDKAEGDASSSEQRLRSFATHAPWKRLEEGIKSLLPAGATHVVSQESGTVTVTSTPAVLDRVAVYISQQNAIMSRQVAVTARVLSVDISKTDDYKFDTSLVLSDVVRGLGLTLSSVSSLPGAAVSGGGQALFAIASPTKSGTKYDHFDGSQAEIKALTEHLNTSLLTSATVITTNNQPTPVHVGLQQNYLKKAEFSQGQNSDSVSLEPGMLTTGFQMMVLPRILSNNSVMLQYTLGLSELITMDEIGSGGTTIQLPQVKTRSFLQNVLVKSGDTLILSGFEQNKSKADDSSNGFWSSGVAAEKSRTMIVILLTPVIIQDPTDAAFKG